MSGRWTVRRPLLRLWHRRALHAAALVSVAVLGACTSFFLDASRYFDDATVGHIDLTDSGLFAGLTVLDGVADSYDVFLVGEAHGSAENLDFAYRLFRYLHERRGVRTYVAEIGFAAGEQLNAYAQGDGTDADLRLILDASEGTSAWTVEWFAFWRRLRVWNTSLEPGRKLRVIGIDVEHQSDRGFTYLQGLLPGTPAPESIEAAASGLADWTAQAGSVASRALAEAAHDSIDEHEEAWQSWLDGSFHAFRIAVRNLVRRYEYYDDPSDAELREAAIYDNFLDVRESIVAPDERLMTGLWGNSHIPTSPVRGFAWLGARLDVATDSPAAGRVFSIVPFYDQSYALLPRPYRTAPIDGDRLVIRLLAPYARGVATLFLLDAEGSPFRETAALSPDGSGATTDFYGAAVLFTGARAATPLGGW